MRNWERSGSGKKETKIHGVVISIKHCLPVTGNGIEESFKLTGNCGATSVSWWVTWIEYKSGVGCHEADFRQFGIRITFWNPVEDYGVNSLEVVPIWQKYFFVHPENSVPSSKRATIYYIADLKIKNIPVVSNIAVEWQAIWFPNIHKPRLPQRFLRATVPK